MNFRRVALALLTCAAAAQQQPKSPEVNADRIVTFRLFAPKATEVTVSGEFMKDSKALVKDDKGVWSVTIGPIEPEIYNYNFTIDGVKTIDPGNPNVKTGSTPSTIQSILEVRDSGPAFYDGQPVPHGEIRTLWYHSKSLGTLRRVTIYTPPGYDTSQTRYPVLHLFHGANADETAWTRLGHVNLILDNLLAAKKAKPFVVVMPFGYGIAPGTPRGTGPSSEELFTKDLIEDVIPLVQARFRVSSDRTQRAIAGLSMGGGESLMIGLNHIELFSYVAGFSAALRPAEFDKTYASVAAKPKAVNEALKLLWIGCGRDDSLMKNNQDMAKFLTDHGIKFTFRESEGAHTWMVWRRYLNELAPLLFQ
ncbi:MAG TPA: alpha/beta hydrolase-fold protein [Candidatus Solibacter sp.]|nr:alpha/beta hydrolase-fold protein [Candidatus Solibacter sp.]